MCLMTPAFGYCIYDLMDYLGVRKRGSRRTRTNSCSVVTQKHSAYMLMPLLSFI